MTMASPERRASPRIDIDGDMTYRVADTDEGKSGRIENISTGGALIWISEELPVDTQLLIRIDPSEPEDEPMIFRATLLHQISEQYESMFAYGCSIQVVKGIDYGNRHQPASARASIDPRARRLTSFPVQFSSRQPFLYNCRPAPLPEKHPGPAQDTPQNQGHRHDRPRLRFRGAARGHDRGGHERRAAQHVAWRRGIARPYRVGDP